MTELPRWENDRAFGIWLNEMLDWEIEQYECEEMVPDLGVIRNGKMILYDVKNAITDAENLKYERLASLLEEGVTTPALLKWIAAELRSGGFKARTPASKKIAHAAKILKHMRRLCQQHYGRSQRRKPLKSLVAFAAERCKIQERSLHKHLNGR